MRPVFAALAGLLTAAVISTQALAQRTVDTGGEREVIGLVLSGGGARGGAHLGVIKALEELRVPVDVIAGTSIGAAIGGLYASGMTTDELEAFLDGIDWEAAFLNSTPRELQTWQRKREDDLFLLQLTTGRDDEGFSLPLGVVQGQVIDTILSRVTLPVATVSDFDQLAIPFRAVASNIGTGEAVILSGGSLAHAIRASMAVPAALTPISIDGTLLVDGGIAMNLPVDPAMAMGAERIIAVDISEKLTEQDDLNDVFGITLQLSSLLTIRGTTEQIERLGPDDILLTPEFDDDYSSMSFAQLPATVDAGYRAVMDQRDQFEALQLSPEAYAAWRASLPDPRATEPPTIRFLKIGDTWPLASSIVEWRMKDVQVDQKLDVDVLEESLNRVYGLGVFSNVRYAVVEDDGQQGLQFELVPPSTELAAQSYGLGVNYSSATSEDARFGLAASIQRDAINESAGEWRATILFGDEPGFFGYFNQPFGTKALNFYSPSLAIHSRILNVFSGDELLAEYNLRKAVFEFGAGREFMDWAEIRGGFRVGAGDTRDRVGMEDVIPYDDFHIGEVFTRFSVDTLDSLSFPRTGVFATMEWRGANESVLGADHDYDQLLASVAHARTWGRTTFLSTLRYDTTVSGEAPAYSLFGIGGFRDLSGLNNDERTGQHVARLGTSIYREIGDLALFQTYVGANIEVGNAWDSRDDMDLDSAIWGGSLWAGVDTPLGPVFLAWGTAEGGEDAFYIFLGRLF